MGLTGKVRKGTFNVREFPSENNTTPTKLPRSPSDIRVMRHPNRVTRRLTSHLLQTSGFVKEQRSSHRDVERVRLSVERNSHSGRRGSPPECIRPFALVTEHNRDRGAIIHLRVVRRPCRIGQKNSHTALSQGHNQLWGGRGGNGKVKQRSHRGADRLRVTRIHGPGGRYDGRGSSRVRDANDRPQVSGVLDPVRNHHDQPGGG